MTNLNFLCPNYELMKNDLNWIKDLIKDLKEDKLKCEIRHQEFQ